MGIVSLAELVNGLKEKNVYIPLYQRNYKWTDSKEKKNGSGRLMKDILNRVYPADGQTRDFVLGMITVYEPREGEIEILDGQQRMVTLSLIMKALGKMESDWFKLQFARDQGNGTTPRYDFLYKDDADNEPDSVDVRRMKCNYTSITEVLDDLEAMNGSCESEIKDRVVKYMGEHIKVFLHKTKREPIDEFLNMNFNKTPFCASDYIKSYMILDSAGGEKTRNITTDDVMALWKKIGNVLYQLKELTVAKENSMENEMFELIKQGYEHIQKNRMEVLFEHKERYYEGSKINADKYFEKKDSLNAEYVILQRYYDIMKQLLEELIIKDKDGIRHPNYTAYSAYNLLHSKNSSLKFFELFNNVDTVQQVLYSQFNLTEESYNRLDKTKAQNITQFMEAMLATKSTTEEEKAMIGGVTNGLENMSQYKNLFDESFQEFISMLEIGKRQSSSEEKEEEQIKNNVYDSCVSEGEEIELNLNRTYTLRELFANRKVKKIVIPQLQRDYVMGSNETYLLNYLRHIRYEEIRVRHKCMVAKDNIIPLGCVCGEELKVSEGKMMDLFEKEVIPSQKDSINYSALEKIPCEGGKRKERYGKARNYARFLFDTDKVIQSKFTTLFPDEVNLKAYTEEPLAGVLNMKNEIVDYWLDYMERLKKAEVNEYKIKMNSSCIMGHLDNQGTFWVYDGQQRITSAVVLLAYLLRNESCGNEIKKYLTKFSFEGRQGANRILTEMFTKPEEEIEKLRTLIEDQTGFSLYVFWKRLTKKDLPNNGTGNALDEIRQIDPKFIWDGMDFELVLMKKISEAEQMFIEMNEGVKLEEEEKYKAQLCHLMNLIRYEKREEFLRKLDNEWLDAFKEFDKEEYQEIKCLQYCITMSYWERNGYVSREESSLEGISGEILDLASSIMDMGMCEIFKKYNLRDSLNGIRYWSVTTPIPDESRFSYVVDGTRLYFDRKGLSDFIEKAHKFCNESQCYKAFFRCIKTIREGEGVDVELFSDDEEAEQGYNVIRRLLETRKNRYEFENTKHWEDNREEYAVDFSEKCYKLSKKLKESEDMTPSYILKLEDAGNLNLNQIYEKMSQKGINNAITRYCDKREKSFKVSVDKELIKAIILHDDQLKKLYSLGADVLGLAKAENNSSYNSIVPSGELVDILRKRIETCIGNRQFYQVVDVEVIMDNWLEWIKDSFVYGRANFNYMKILAIFAINRGIGYVKEDGRIGYVNCPDGKIKELYDRVCFKQEIVAEFKDNIKNEVLREIASGNRSFNQRKISGELFELYQSVSGSMKRKIADYIVEYYKNTADDECFEFVIWYLKKMKRNDDDVLNHKTRKWLKEYQIAFEDNELSQWVRLFKGEAKREEAEALIGPTLRKGGD